MPNTRIEHPSGGGYAFGSVKAVDQRKLSIPGGPIYLKRGKHRGANKGYGVAHIWTEHSKEVAKALQLALSDEELISCEAQDCEKYAASYVAKIVCAGSPIYCEFSGFGSKHRLAVVRTSTGTAILEYIEDRAEPHYSVVTAYSKKFAHGTLVSTVL